MEIKDVIKKLQELDNKDYKIEFEIEPIVECVESIDGSGYETTKYRYTITLESNEVVKRYKNNHGIKEYIERR